MTEDLLNLPLTLNGITLSPEEVKAWCHHRLITAEHDWEKNLANFLLQWYDSAQPAIAAQTSGSTGTPRTLYFSREAMFESARRTCNFFGLHKGMTALLCLNTSFIAGKMMVVRALAGGLNLIVAPPVQNPLQEIISPPDFVAMVPTQIIAVLENPNTNQVLQNSKTILIGGAPLPAAVETLLASLHSDAWITYGMTETLTHVAVRRAGEDPPAFRPLPGVTLTTAMDGTLCIYAPFLESEIKTNDLAEILPDGRFILKGRADFVINSGGIKIFPEALEQRLSPFFRRPFFVTSQSHPVLGEVPVIIAEASLITEKDIKELSNFIATNIPRHERPFALIPVRQIIMSEGGKILRIQTLHAEINQPVIHIELNYD
ncbi:MAG: o-succinylbenzoate---CoA ligase [Bacteroidales bacterium]|jgi:O-succinylbenzoic acid--CoA ligase|nr:o-succinylbenzoate---CoA ligase [Bacteroidales bacterium]MDN5329609.1 o-succinylbenzoate---CoA ligase [Bacteroidales bacterium]